MPGTSRTDAYDVMPATWSAWRLTTWTSPVKPASRTCRRTTWPKEPSSRPAPTTTTDDGSSSDCTDRASARCSRAYVTASESSVGSRSKDSRDDPVVELLVDDVAGVGEDAEHLAVGRQDVGDEAREPALPCCCRDVLQEDGAQPAALVRVLDVERDLGHVGRDALVPDDADHLVADGGDEGSAVLVVDVGEALDVAVGEVAVEGEEPVVDGLVGQARVEAAQPVDVVGPDRPQVGGASVAEDDVRLPVRWVRRLVGHAAEASQRGGTVGRAEVVGGRRVGLWA